MPRKRKKENERRQSLLFVESPVENQRHNVSPVSCADNPITVNRVPVMDDTDISWVSPQFQGIHVSHGKRRQARRRQSCMTTRHRSVLNKENTFADSIRPTSRRRFPALQFMLDGQNEPLSAHNHFTRDQSLRSAARKHAARRRSLPAHRGSTVEGSAGDDCGLSEVNQIHMDSSGVADSVIEPNSVLESSATASLTRSVHGKAPVSNTCTPTGRRKRKTRSASQAKRSDKFSYQVNSSDRDNNTNSPSLNSSSVKGKGADSQRGKGKRKSYSSHILLSPPESENYSELSWNDRGHAAAIFKMLNVHSVSPSDKNFVDSVCSDDALFHTVNRPSGLPWKTRESQKITPNRQRFETSSLSQPRRSARLREKYREALKYLRPSTPDGVRSSQLSCERSVAVLVADTPESEYGSRLRKCRSKYQC